MSPDPNRSILITHAFMDRVVEKLRAADLTMARVNQAIAVLWIILRHLEHNQRHCQKTARELGWLLGIHESEIARALILLEEVGAIERIRGTRPKVIAISADDVYFIRTAKSAQIIG